MNFQRVVSFADGDLSLRLAKRPDGIQVIQNITNLFQIHKLSRRDTPGTFLLIFTSKVFQMNLKQRISEEAALVTQVMLENMFRFIQDM